MSEEPSVSIRVAELKAQRAERKKRQADPLPFPEEEARALVAPDPIEEEGKQFRASARRKLARKVEEVADPDEASEDDEEDEEDEEEDEPLELHLPPSPPPPPPLKPARVAAPVVQPAQPAYTPPKKVATLEDLYAVFPDIGNGLFRIRVERTQPRNYGGFSIAGFLGDFDHKMPMAEFQAQFGGGRYTVHVMGPVRGREDLSRVLENVDIMIPGPPLLGSFATGEDSMMGGPQRSQFVATEPPNVQIKKLEIESEQKKRDEAERRRLQDQVNNAGSNNNPFLEHAIESVKSQADKTVENVKSLADQTIQMQREQYLAAVKTLIEKEAELRDLRNQIVEERKKSLEAVTKAEADLERRMKDLHEASLRALSDRHASDMATLRDQHQNTMNEASRRYSDDLARRDSDASKERDRIIREYDRNEASLKSTFESRYNDLVRSSERELILVKEQRDRDVSSMKMNFESTKEISKETSSVRLAALNDEISRLRAHNETLTRDNDVMRKAQNKDPRVFLAETKETAMTILGMVDPSEIRGTPEEPEFDWKKEAAKGAISFMQGVPATIEKIVGGAMAAREQNRVTQEVVQAQGVEQRRVRQRTAPNPWAATYSQVANEIPFAPPMMYQPQAPQVQAAQQPQSPQPLQQEAVQQAQQSSPEAAAAPEPTATQLEEGLLQFIDQIDKAIRADGLISPAVFAKNFVDAVGIEQAEKLLQQLPADKFIELVPQGKGAAITTRDGRQFVRAVWTEAKAEVSRAKAAAQ